MKYIAMMLIMLFSTGNIVLAGDINTTVDTEKQAVFKEEKKKSSKKKKEKVVEEVAIEASVEATTPDVEEKVVATEEKKTTKKKDSDAYPAAQDDLSDTLYGNTRVIDNADIRATEGSKTVIVEDGITPKDESYTIDDLLLEDDFIPYSSDETLLSTFSKDPSQWDSSAQFTPYRSNAEADIYNLGTSSGLINRYQIRAGYQKNYFINSQKKAAMRTAKLYNAYKNYGVSKRNAEDEATMNTAVVSQ